VVPHGRIGLRHPPSAALGARPAALAGKGYKLVVTAVRVARPQEAVRQDAAFEEGVEFVFDELRQFGLGERRTAACSCTRR